VLPEPREDAAVVAYYDAPSAREHKTMTGKPNAPRRRTTTTGGATMTPPADKPAAKRGRLALKDPACYTPSGPHSFFRDLVAVEHERWQRRERDRLETEFGQRLGAGVGEPLFGSRSEGGDQGGIREARDRLARLDYKPKAMADFRESVRERRDVTTGDPGFGTFLPGGAVPSYIASAFATAARAEATLSTILPTSPLPASGMTVVVPHLDTGAAVALQVNEDDNATEQDLTAGRNPRRSVTSSAA
jgi:hypothetical protein